MAEFDCTNPVIKLDRKIARFERSCGASDAKSSDRLASEEALRRLEEGNANFRASTKPCFEIGDFDPEVDPPKQCPIAVVVCCSDSRVPPELIFWQGLGRLFIVRVAGNTVDAAALGSIAHAVSELDAPLVVVLGHEHCGAVEAAVKFVEQNAGYDGMLAGVVEPILPAVIAERDCTGSKDLVEASMRANVKRTVDKLRVRLASVQRNGTDRERLWVVGARYDVNDGSVDFFYRPEPVQPSPAIV